MMNSGMRTWGKALYCRDLGNSLIPVAGPSSGSRARATARIILAALMITEIVFIRYFEHFLSLQQNVFMQGALMEVEYQRRARLVPRLIGISREYSRHERILMSYMADARALKTRSRDLSRLMGPARSAQMDKAFSRLVALVERYPDLKADQSYKALMAKTVTTENRIASAREAYVAAINDYNRTVRTFPDSLFARLLGFHAFAMYAPEKDPMPEKNRKFFFIY